MLWAYMILIWLCFLLCCAVATVALVVVVDVVGLHVLVGLCSCCFGALWFVFFAVLLFLCGGYLECLCFYGQMVYLFGSLFRQFLFAFGLHGCCRCCCV